MHTDTEQSSSEETTRELERIGAEWAEAMVANDAERIGSFMADEWMMVSERGISEKQYFLNFVRSGALTHSKFEMVGEARIKIYGDTAVLSARVVNTAHFGGQQFEQDEWTTDVFVKKDGRWLCVHSHITPADKNFNPAPEETK